MSNLQPPTQINILAYLRVFHPLEGFHSQHEDLPDADAEHPDVAGGGEPPEVDALRRHPLDGQLPLGGLQTCNINTLLTDFTQNVITFMYLVVAFLDAP